MIVTVCAGHGNGDPGAVAVSGHTEAELMTELRNMVAVCVTDNGHRVRTDGSWLQNWALVKALTLIPGSDVAIELHCNAFTSPSAGGVEVISLPAQRIEAQRIAATIARVLEIPLRGDKGWIDQSKSARGRLAFVRAGGMIIETFFISNPDELARYRVRKGLLAEAIATAVAPRGAP